VIHGPVRHVLAFVRVVESQGFTAAARRLNLSITTVSGRVQALEDSLGVRLLNRTTRRVNLTDIGREYYGRCSQLLHELDEADELASIGCGSGSGAGGSSFSPVLGGD
jgi:DNA-binding transcriptional LysR family regulator